MDAEQQRLATQITSRPAFVVAYGNTGIGKSVANLYSFPRGIHIAGWGALKPSVSTVGYVPPAIVEVKPDELMIGRLRDEVSRAKAKYKDADAVVIDDLSVVITRTARGMESKYKDGRKLYGVLGGLLGAAVDEWASMGLHTVVDCHEKPPTYETEEGGPQPRGTLIAEGGPALPGSMGPAIVKASTMAYHAVVDPMRRPWPLAFRAGPHEGHHLWLSKDRDNIIRGRGPANLAEIMRKAGYKVSRPVGWEWHEECVEWAAQAILQGHPESAVLTEVAKKVMPANGKPGTGPFALRWIVRDTQSRVELRRADPFGDIRSLGINF